MAESQAIAEAALPFQPDAVEIEERPVSGRVRWVLWTVTALIASAVTWASLASIDRVVTAPGRLITTAPKMVLQPLVTSVLTSIEIGVGDTVRAGDVLVRLDPTVSRANVVQLRQRLAALAIEIERLRAEVEEEDFALVGTRSDDLDLVLQQRIFQQRKAERAAQLGAYDQEINRLRAEIQTNRRAEATLGRQIEIIDQFVAVSEQLLERQAGTRKRVLELEAEKLQLQRERDGLLSRNRETRFEIDRQRAERRAFLRQWQTAEAVQLSEKLAAFDQMTEELRKAELLEAQTELIAPMDAVVLEVGDHSLGSIASEGQPLVTLVPAADPLEVEVEIVGRDVGRIQPGDAVRIKLEAAPYQRHGTLEGEIRLISEDALPRQDGMEVVYRARIELAGTALHGMPAGFRLLPGMSAQAEIKVGRRRVISYFLYPLLRTLDESLREP